MIFAALVCLSPHVLGAASGMVVEGRINSRQNWVFVGRFCFRSLFGRFEYFVQYPKEFAVQKLVFYHAGPDQWSDVYDPGMNCSEKESRASRAGNRLIELTNETPDSGCSLVQSLVQSKWSYRCSGIRRFDLSEEGWWFIAVSNCDSLKGVNLAFKMLMVNGAPGDFWYEHFSADQFHVLPMYITSSLLHLVLVMLCFLCKRELRSRQLLHVTYRLFDASVRLGFFGAFLALMSFLKFAHDGVDLGAFRLTGEFLSAASSCLFVLLVLLVSKGYTVTRARMSLGSALRLTIFMTAYAVAQLGLCVYKETVLDYGRVVQLAYESPVGYGLMALQACALLLLWRSCFLTARLYPEKGGFYCRFTAFYSSWFLLPHLGAAVSRMALSPPYGREGAAAAVHMVNSVLGFFFFYVMTVPSKTNQNFPFHVRTCQVSTMEIDPLGKAGGSTLDSFAHHNYAVPGTAPKKSSSRPVVRVSILAAERAALFASGRSTAIF